MMTQVPKTLWQLSGITAVPAPLAQSALILIDHQREYVSGGLPLVGMGPAVGELAALLALARGAAMPVFHVVHHGPAGSPLFDPAGPHVAILPELTPERGEAVIIKSRPNSFAGTDLHRLVQATGRTNLIVGGFATHMCVSATVRAALDLGYGRTTVVAAATATRDLPDPLGGVIPAETVRRASLAALADRFAVVVGDIAALTETLARGEY